MPTIYPFMRCRLKPRRIYTRRRNNVVAAGRDKSEKLVIMMLQMIVKKPSFYMFCTGTLIACAIAMPRMVWAQAESGQSGFAAASVIAALKKGDLAEAEKAARDQLSEAARKTPVVEPDLKKSPADPDEKSLSAEVSEEQQAQTALATVLAARAWEAEQRMRAGRITGSDIVLLIVIVLFAGGILALLLRYGPQRPKIVDKAEQWVERMSSKTQDDGFKQAGAAMYSLLIFGLICGGLLLLVYGTIHLIAGLDASVRSNPELTKYYDEARMLMAKARPQTAPAVKYEDSDVLALYSTFLRKTGDDARATEVERHAIGLRNRGSCSVGGSGSGFNDRQRIDNGNFRAPGQ